VISQLDFSVKCKPFVWEPLPSDPFPCFRFAFPRDWLAEQNQNLDDGVIRNADAVRKEIEFLVLAEFPELSDPAVQTLTNFVFGALVRAAGPAFNYDDGGDYDGTKLNDFTCVMVTRCRIETIQQMIEECEEFK
jgi:hypothetical protein